MLRIVHRQFGTGLNGVDRFNAFGLAVQAGVDRRVILAAFKVGLCAEQLLLGHVVRVAAEFGDEIAERGGDGWHGLSFFCRNADGCSCVATERADRHFAELGFRDEQK